MSEEATLDEFDDAREAESDETHERLSDNWDEVSLIELCEMGGGSTPKKSNADYWEGGEILWTTPKDFDGSRLKETEDAITEQGAEESHSKIYPPGTTLLVVRSGVLRHTLPVSIAEEPTTVNQDLKALEPDREQINPEYFFQALSGLSEDIRGSCKKTGTTVESIQTNVLKQYPVPVPPLEEQRKIATVLYTIDQAIQKTEEIIGHLRNSRQGLSQDLLTEGLQQKESVSVKVGPLSAEIPENWKVLTVDAITNTIYRYPTYQNIDYVEQGIPEVRVGMLPGDGSIAKGEENYISESTSEEYPRTELEEGDTVMAVRGATLGKIGFVPEWLDGGNINPNLIRIEPNKEVLDRYLTELFRSGLIQRQVNAFSQQTTVKTITSRDIRRIAAPIPPVPEQSEILEVLSDVSDRIENEERYQLYLQKLKRGLMQDLLSGAVRTHDADIDIPEAVLAHG